MPSPTEILPHEEAAPPPWKRPSRRRLIQFGLHTIRRLTDRGLAPSPEHASFSNAVEALEKRHYVKEAPRLDEQAADETRMNIFRYDNAAVDTDRTDPSFYTTAPEMTEHEGLQELHSFLTDIASSGEPGPDAMAREMLDDLTFIGEKEYTEAASGLGELWKEYLDTEPGRQMCVLTNITGNSTSRKSDAYLLDRVLSTFTDEELARYAGRLVTELSDIPSSPQETRIVLLDDWMISGAQMRQSYHDVETHLEGYEVEINLITGSADHIQHGLKIDKYDKRSPSVPVKAYYRSHSAQGSREEHGAYVSGTHSSVDYDFRDPLSTLLQIKRKIASTREGQIRMPAIGDIIRPYRYTKSEIEVLPHGGGIVRRH